MSQLHRGSVRGNLGPGLSRSHQPKRQRKVRCDLKEHCVVWGKEMLIRRERSSMTNETNELFFGKQSLCFHD